MQAPPVLWQRNGGPIVGPQPFDPDATLLAADFSQAAYAQVSRAPGRGWRYTVYAFTYVHVGGYRVCAVAHTHIINSPANNADWGPGNCYFPGLFGWETPTSAAIVNRLRTLFQAAIVQAVQATPNLPGGHILVGAFPAGNDRYPTII